MLFFARARRAVRRMMEVAAPPARARVACVAASAAGAREAWRHAHAAPHARPAAVATAAAAAGALRAARHPPRVRRRVRRLFLPDSYAHRWEEFPHDTSETLWVWCETDDIWDLVQKHRPHAVRWAGYTRPTFPPAPLRVDAETGRFAWALPDGAELRAWGEAGA